MLNESNEGNSYKPYEPTNGDRVMVSHIGHLQRRRGYWEVVGEEGDAVVVDLADVGTVWHFAKLPPVLPRTPGSVATHFVWGHGDVIGVLDETGRWTDRFKSYEPDHFWPTKILHDAGAQ